MRAVRMHDYKQPLVIEEVPITDIAPDEVFVKVKPAGMLLATR
jgi:propanol-preferring alcohol dehydrogenase